MEITRRSDVCNDPVISDQWYALAALPEIPTTGVVDTILLGEPVRYGFDDHGRPQAWRRGRDDEDELLPVRDSYGYLWTSVGTPPDEVFAIPETHEADRRTMNMVTVGIEVSAGRAVENFLDMAHFPFVHTHYLGEEPHTEVVDYDVEMRDGELWAVDCAFYQPRASASASEPIRAQYLYRVPHPYCAMLYKSCPTDLTRLDAIGIFVHPLDEESIRAHLFSSLIDDVNTDTEIRRFQQAIISQDKPILENQFPKRLPLDPRAETPIRADKSAILYRRWLRELGVTYGVIAA